MRAFYFQSLFGIAALCFDAGVFEIHFDQGGTGCAIHSLNFIYFFHDSDLSIYSTTLNDPEYIPILQVKVS